MTSTHQRHTITSTLGNRIETFVFMISSEMPAPQVTANTDAPTIEQQKLEWAISAIDKELGYIAEMTSQETGSELSEYTACYADGSISMKESLKNGERHGEWASYDPEGKITIKGHYANGQKEGAWYEDDKKSYCWYEKGEPIFRADYDEILALLDNRQQPLPNNLQAVFQRSAKTRERATKGFETLLLALARENAECYGHPETTDDPYTPFEEQPPAL